MQSSMSQKQVEFGAALRFLKPLLYRTFCVVSGFCDEEEDLLLAQLNLIGSCAASLREIVSASKTIGESDTIASEVNGE